jgi:hypothetical protein
VRVKLLRNIEAYGGDVGLVTLNAPGTEWSWDVSQCADVPGHTHDLANGCVTHRLEWDEEHCSHRGPHRHRGPDGCRVEPVTAKRWNRAARFAWTKIHRKASQRGKRQAAKDGHEWGVIAREWEFQKRGVLHMHVVVPMNTAAERRCSQIYVQALDEFRERHGFGFVDRGKGRKRKGVWGRLIERIPQQRAARYLAKYIAAVDGSKLSLGATVTHPDVPGHVTYVGRQLTSRTRITMRTLRDRRFAFCQACAIEAAGEAAIVRIALRQHGIEDHDLAGALWRALVWGVRGPPDGDVYTQV